MKYFIPDNFKNYKFFKTNFYTLLFFTLTVFLYLFFSDFLFSLFINDVYYSFNSFIINTKAIIITCIFLLISIVFLILSLIYYIAFARFKKYTFIEITDKFFKYSVNNTFLLYFKDIIFPTKNILRYEISQGFFMKRFNLYKVTISSGSVAINVHITSDYIYEFENIIQKYIKDNSFLVVKEEKLYE